MQKLDKTTKDICFQTEADKRFRLRAAAIIIEKNHVLFATNDKSDYYYSIGGAIELGETAEQAVVREVFEETGVNYEVDRLAFVEENFFKQEEGLLKGLECHEVVFFFLMKPRGRQEVSSNSKTFNNTVDEQKCWLPINEFDKYEAFPKWMGEKIKDIKPYIEHIVTLK